MRKPRRTASRHIDGETAFRLLWHAEATDTPLVREYRFHPTRRWRFDFAHPSTHVAVEIEGGIWIQGRHLRARGYEADCEKYSTAALHGWLVVRLTPNMLRHDGPAWVQDIRAVIRERMREAAA